MFACLNALLSAIQNIRPFDVVIELTWTRKGI